MIAGNHYIIAGNHFTIPEKHSMIPETYYTIPQKHSMISGNHYIIPQNIVNLESGARYYVQNGVMVKGNVILWGNILLSPYIN